MSELVSAPRRDEWEIKEDMRALKRAIAILKDPARLKDVQDMIKSERNDEKSMDLLIDGRISEALGLDESMENEPKETKK